MNPYHLYEPVIGLEVHIQLSTLSKAYSADSASYGNNPNTNISVISLGHPGTLPKVNKRVAEFAVKLGLAVKANITRENQFARKNYFYADLPKGYQITQDKTPICTGGFIRIRLSNGQQKHINLTRIHMEEDAGKSMHDQDPYDSLIDLNRAGVPLLEMVSEPEIENSDEAYAFLTEVRKLVQYLDICDGNMEEGSMRCDANVSVRKKGVKEFGVKVEVKNMNSIRNVQRAIEYEITRQIDVIESGNDVAQETRSFDAVAGTTFSLRSKEMANDYRYFPEPDLNPLILDEAYISNVKKEMPALPDELYDKFTGHFGLTEYDAVILSGDKPMALYYNNLCSLTGNFKAAANWMIGPVKSFLNERAVELESFPLSTEKIAQLIAIVDDGVVSFSVASQKIFPLLLENPNASPKDIAVQNNWVQESNTDLLGTWIQEVLHAFPDKVEEYKKGKTGLIGMFMGEVMKRSKGKADPKTASELVKQALDNA
jgi:aspartyl-tRNA(Asn)/glutamyl-tRNA(Gln) amidotransferase subunit B